MSDREWLEGKAVYGHDLKPLIYYVRLSDAAEYGERCARGKSKIISSDHFDHVSTSEWKLSCGHTTVTNVGYQPNNCEWCGAEVYYE